MMKRVLGAAMLSLLAVGSAGAGEWYESLKLKGDVRVRFEQIDQDGRDVRDRARIRARVGVYGQVNEDVDVGIGLATGSSDDPVSRNLTLGEGFTPKSFLLDKAYFDWHPSALKGLHLIGGKMDNPFLCVGDYIWDGDLTPEGGAAKFSVGDKVKFLATAGGFQVIERSADNETMLYGVQGAMEVKPADTFKVLAGVSYYMYDNMMGYSAIDSSGAGNFYGNSRTSVVSGGTTNTFYANDYAMLEPFVKVELDVGMPISLFASYVNNGDADEDNTGYMVGATLGKAKDKNSFELSYDYRELEKDATVGAFADSDSWGGGTDGNGHKISAKYQILKNWQAAVTYLINEKGLETETDYRRLEVDLIAKF